MDTYLDQLIADLAAEATARRRVLNGGAPQTPEAEDQELEQHFAEVERFVNSAPETHLLARAGLRLEQFPPAEKLSEAQAARLVEALVDLWHAYCCDIHLPEAMPARRQYTLTVKYSAEPMFFFAGGGTFHMDFCTGEPVGCELEEYCPCLQYRDEDFTLTPPTDTDPSDLPY